MNAKMIHTARQDYSKMNVDTLIELKNWIEDFPYCQSAHILYLLNLKRLGEDTFDRCLPQVAIRVYDRELLRTEVGRVEQIASKPYATPVPKAKPLPKTKFAGKTLTDFLHLTPNAKEETSAEQHSPLPQKKQVAKTLEIPLAKDPEDILLNQLHQEALARVNERLAEINSFQKWTVDFAEQPTKRIQLSQNLIDKVITDNPKISRVKESDGIDRYHAYKKKEERSLKESEGLVSETLALMLIQQGALGKAIETLESLAEWDSSKKEYCHQLIQDIQKVQKKTNTSSTEKNKNKKNNQTKTKK